MPPLYPNSPARASKHPPYRDNRLSVTEIDLDSASGCGYDGCMSKVSAEQLDMVRAWAAQGIDLNGIQKRLSADCGVHLTYMDVRFLLLDNGIEIATAPEPVKEEPAAPADQPAAEEPAAPAPAVDGKPVVTLDDLQIPGALLSGKVVFPGGTKGSWMIDQMGRFSWSDLSAQPSPAELQAFQFELTQLLR